MSSDYTNTNTSYFVFPKYLIDNTRTDVLTWRYRLIGRTNMTNEQTSAAQPVPAYVAVPDTGAGPGVLVLHAWWGLNEVFKQLCDRLAGEGLSVAAPDLYGDGRVASTIAQAQQQVDQTDDAIVQQQAIDALAYLRAHPAVRGDKIGVIGFSFGAAWALLLSATLPDQIGAVVVFYGAYAIDFGNANAAYLGHFAPGDPWEPDEGVRELEDQIHAAGRDVTFHTYPGTEHWFFEADRPEYNAEAAQLAWERTVAFLRERLTTA